MDDPVIQGGCGRTVMARQPQDKNVTDEQRQLFLDALAGSCNVRQAAVEAGFAPSTAYKIRQRDTGFAAAWQAAIETGYVRLETALVERAILTIETSRDDAPDASPVVGAMTVAQAIDLMNKHRASIEGGRAKRVRLNARQRPTAEETDAEILRRIAVIERQRVKPAAQEGD
ncbi:hypothetical protein [Sphingopyxis sp. R3-92]|uniref:hypothetical protein n=1 Tax=Sphingopyxis sp. R3-92 TaxID=3158553 RepID=UPI003EE7B58C